MTMATDNQPANGENSLCSGTDTVVRVSLTGSDLVHRRLAPLFSGGVGVDVESGCTVRVTLTDQLDIAPDYVEGRLQTIFLNGHPVDDIDAARVVDGDVLALSAAMPGLVGATMRRGGRYAVLRQDISHKAEADCSLDAGPMCLRLKLFNLIAAELAPAMFHRGVWVDGNRLSHQMALMGRHLWETLSAAEADGVSAEPEALAARVQGQVVWLQVMAA